MLCYKNKKEIACIGENVCRCKETPTESWCFLTTMFPETLANPSFLDLQAITSDIFEILLSLADHFIASQNLSLDYRVWQHLYPPQKIIDYSSYFIFSSFFSFVCIGY